MTTERSAARRDRHAAFVQAPGAPLTAIGLDELLRRTRVYERWAAPVSADLRHRVIWSLGSLGLNGLLLIWSVPHLSLAEPPPVLVGSDMLAAGLQMAALWRGWLLAVISAGIVLLTAGAAATGGLQRGDLAWHWGLWVGTVCGACGMAALLGFVMILVVNLALVLALVGLGAALLRVTLSWLVATARR